jgi:hypothetical protein
MGLGMPGYIFCVGIPECVDLGLVVCTNEDPQWDDVCHHMRLHCSFYDTIGLIDGTERRAGLALVLFQDEV